MKKRLELIEKYAVVFGALLGVIAFIWQVYDTVDKQKEKLITNLNCIVLDEDVENIELSLEVINVGQRPVYIRTASIVTFPEGVSGAKELLVVFAMEKTQNEPVLPGAGKEYSHLVNLDEVESWLDLNNNLYIWIESPSNSIIQENITSQFRDSISDVKKVLKDTAITFQVYFPCSP